MYTENEGQNEARAASPLLLPLCTRFENAAKDVWEDLYLGKRRNFNHLS
jgi:hypothetical protein